MKKYIIYNKRRLKHSLILSTIMLAFLVVIRNYSDISILDMLLSSLFVIITSLFISIDFNFPRTVEGTFTASLLIAMPLISFFSFELMNEINIFNYNNKLFILNLFFYYVIYITLFALIKKPSLSLGLSAFIIEIAAIINQAVIQFKGLPVLPWDILSIETALSVSQNYRLYWNINMVKSILITFAMIILASKAAYIINSFKVRIITKLALLALVSLSAFHISDSDFLEKQGVTVDLWNLREVYSNNGTLLSFIHNMNFMKVEKPLNYRRAAIEEMFSLEVLASSKSSMAKNIIVVMNESFADFRTIGNLETNTEFLPFYDSLKDNVIKGNTYVSVFGGGTANSEFEFLTGNTMAFLPEGSIPFQMYLSNKTDSLPNHLKNLGFTNIAAHPYGRAGWNRESAYASLGFDDFLSIEHYENITYTRDTYPSDKTAYEKIIELYEEAGDEPLLLYTVTMQNHGGYSFDFDNNVRATNLDGEYPQLSKYLSLLQESDRELENLLSYFKDVDEPTVILLFGDHQPSVEPEFYDEILSKSDIQDPIELQQQKYITPFLIWANYDIPEKEYPTDISLNYLSVLLSEIAEVPLTSYQLFLKDLMTEYPIINNFAFMDILGKWQLLDKVENILKLSEYKNLQYYLLFDKEKK